MSNMDLQMDAVLEIMETSEATSAVTQQKMSGEASEIAASGSEAVEIGGYPREILEDKVEGKFICSYCDKLLRNPMQGQCGHRFCRVCRDEMMKHGQEVVCRACEAEGEEEPVLHLNEMFDDKAAIREMKAFKARCVFPGCTWKGPFQRYSEHEESCEKKVVVCPQCKTMVSKATLGHHEKQACSKRPYECQFCHAKMTHDQSEKHQTQCPNAPIPCDKCGAQVPKNEMPCHKDTVCMYREVECPVPDCRVKLPMDQFGSHFTKNSQSMPRHMVFLFNQISQLDRKIVQLEAIVPASSQDAGAVGGAGVPSDATNQQRSSFEAESVGNTLNTESLSSTSQKLKLHEDLMAVLHGEILRCIHQLEALSTAVERNENQVKQSHDKIASLDPRLRELEEKVQGLVNKVSPPTSPIGGTLIKCRNGHLWQLEAFTQIRRAAINDEVIVINSPSFYTDDIGYKLRLRLYANGAEASRGRALSVLVQVQKGTFDNLLPWPFTGKVSVMLIDQRDFKNHATETFTFLANDESSRRPIPTVENPSFGAWNLISLGRMGTNQFLYIQNDTIYIKVEVVVGQEITDRLATLNNIHAMSVPVGTTRR